MSTNLFVSVFCHYRVLSSPLSRRWFGLVTRHWERKRFYKHAQVYKTEDSQYGVKLDHRNLRTPLRKIFAVPTEALAFAVSQEWQAQNEILQPSLMHLTALCNTVTDDPLSCTNDIVTQNALQYLSTETICFRASEPEDLVEMQQKEWDPLLSWFNKRYSGSLKSTTGFILSPPSLQLTQTITKYIHNLNKWSVTGFSYALESCKSLVITCALFEGKVDPMEACELARLEVRHQTKTWGSVEWQHGIEEQDLIARLSAVNLLYRLLNSSSNYCESL